MMPTATIDAHNEDLEDGTSIPFPAASVACNAGDYIVANIGTATSYVGASGTITFGQYWNGTAWTGTGSPYTNVPITWNMEDEAFADVEILATIDFFADPHSGEYPVHNRSGHHAIHGGHIRPKAVGRRHSHPHHPHRAHFRNGVFSLSGGTAAPVLSIVAHSGSSYWVDDALGEWPIPTATCITGTAATGSAPFQGQWPIGGAPGAIVLFDVVNYSGKTAATQVFYTVPKGTDITGDAYVGYMKVGYISDAAGTNTNGDLIFHAYHGGSHQVTDKHLTGSAVQEAHIGPGQVHGGDGTHRNHIAAQAIDGSTAHDHIAHNSIHGGESGNADHHASMSHHVKHARREHHSGHHPYGSTITVSNSSGGTCTVTTPPQLFIWGIDGVSWQVPATTLTGVPSQSYIVFNPSGSSVTSTDGTRVCAVGGVTYFPSGNNFTAASQDPLIILGRLGNTTDPATGQYLMHGHHMSMHQVHGLHVANTAIARRHHALTVPSRYHFGNVIFKISGSGNPYTITPTAQFGTPMLLQDNGAVIVSPISTTAFTCTTGQYIYYKSDTNTWSVQNFGLDLTNPANDVYYHVGRLSDGTDSFTGLPTITGWHQGSHVLHGNHHAPNSVAGVHINSSSISQNHLNGQMVGLGNLKNPGTNGIAATSGQDGWGFTVSSTLWTMRNWANISPPGNGALTGGNMGALTQSGSQFMVEVSLRNNGGAWGSYRRVYRMFLQSNPSSVPLEAQIASDDGQWTIFVQRFDIMTDGTVACVVGYGGNMAIGTAMNVGLQFRIIWAVQS